MSASKTQVLVLYGGKSVEHAVSIRSAANVAKYIDRDLFAPLFIGITRQGHWYLTDDVSTEIQNGKPVIIELAPAVKLTANDKEILFDVVFPLVHGTNGEDGSLQGLFQVLGKPIVGCGVLGSAINMSKITTKKILSQSGIPVTRFLAFQKIDRDKITFESVSSTLGVPFMVKSANLGSSVGINKVNDKAGFEKALEEAFRFDRQILIEEFVKGREIECAILGNFPPEASNPGEIVISDRYEFYDFKAKYVDPDAVRIDVPASLDAETIKKVRHFCEKAYIALECEDYARVDLFLDEKGNVYINEINTIPGFTNASMFPMMWKERGLSFSGLITRLMETAMARTEYFRNIDTDFFSELDS